jgi:hypothetical protein
VADVVFFQSRSELDANHNLAGFIGYCQENLDLYEDQGGYSVNKWHFNIAGRKYTMAFSKYSEKNDSYNFDPMDEPFLTFAKAWIQYTQSIKQVKSVQNKMIVLRLLHDALIAIHDISDIKLTDGLVLQKVRELADLRYPESDLRYRLGQQMEILCEFLRKKFITPTLPHWANPWKRGQAKAGRTDQESRKWQEERCPSMHQMLSIADCFSKAQSREDIYWTSVITLLMFAPSRAGELPTLSVDCLHVTDNGRLGVRWYGEKGYGDTIKWVPDVLRDVVIEAHRRLVEIGSPARDAAKFAYENPGKFFRHSGCVTPPEFPEDKNLSARDFGNAMNFGKKILASLEVGGKDRVDSIRWSIFGGSKWVEKLRENSHPTYEKLAEFTFNEYGGGDWPYISNSDKYIWDSLLLVRDREFHNDFNPRSFSWVQPSVNQINAQLAPRSGLKNPIPTMFQRLNVVDEDGSDIALTSHQLRVWLSTNAERGGMDSWRLAKWAARARIEDNDHYDLRTQQERDEQARAVLTLSERPNALEALKLNLPVSYEDLGLMRIGIADITEYGMCTHDYAMAPCTKGGECMTCKEHVCIKGMPNTLERIIKLEERVNSQFERAKSDMGDAVFGADRWMSHLGWKLAHIRTQRVRLESAETPNGAVLWIAPEHDPSPIKRALEQNQYKTKPNASDTVDVLAIAALLGDFSA